MSESNSIKTSIKPAVTPKHLDWTRPVATQREFLGERFGNFLLINEIARGGMAAAFLARPTNIAANGRVVVVKRILAQVANDPEFLQMFQSEIRVCMGFTHPNIVQIYDFGQVNHQPYIAMEFIEGKTLREILVHFNKSGLTLPVGISVSIAAQAAAALHYAHTFRSRVTGEIIKIIHRDISPQNILLSYDGNVKVIDFGIAKAVVDDIEQTRTVGIRGKVSYLSPEQVRREPLGPTSDVFALGVVLWELLTQQKLFAMPDADDFQLMEMIRNCAETVRPPSKINGAVPKQLDDIVMKALHRDPAERYQTAEDFQKGLRDFIIYSLPGFGYSDVGKFIQSAFQYEVVQERESMKSLNEKAQSFLEAHFASETTAVSLPHIPEAEAAVSPLSGETRSNVHLNVQSPVPLSRAITPLTVTGSGPIVEVVPRKSWMPKITRVRVLGSILYVLTIYFMKVDREYLFFERFLVPTETIRLASQEPPTEIVATPSVVIPKPVRAKLRDVLLKINIQPELAEAPPTIFVNGVRVATRVVIVPLGRKISVRVERKNAYPYQNEFKLNPADLHGAKTFKLDVKLKNRR